MGEASPAMLILAGVAFRDAGVLVRLLLLGVMPLGVEEGYFISLYTKRGNIHNELYSVPGTGSW